MLNDILKLASKGVRVHPLHPKTKTPILTKWTEQASTDPAQITRWFNIQVGCNWGVALGKESGTFVVDIDPKDGGCESWEKLTKTEKPFKTWTATSGSGGKHYYFKYPSKGEVRNPTIAPGINIKGQNGNIVVPPSVHPTTGLPYKWDEGLSPYDIELSSCPKWLLSIVQSASVSGEYTNMGGTLEHGSRNDTMFHNALNSARLGSSKDYVIKSMRNWCNEQGQNDITDNEIETVVDSAYKHYEKEQNKKATIAQSVNKTDDDNADRLISECGHELIYVENIGWHVWDKRYWAYDGETARVTQKFTNMMRTIRDEGEEQLNTTTDLNEMKMVNSRISWANASLNAGKINGAITLASRKNRIRRSVFDLDAVERTKFLLNCRNGTLDLRTGVLKPHDPTDLFTKIIDHNYNPDAQCPQWLHTLELAFNGNKNLIDFMQRAFGYTLSGSTSAQAFFICWGESGNNGKSTILETFSRILGEGYAVMADMKVISTVDADNSVKSSLARMRGARMINFNEADERQRLNVPLMKQLTGGDQLEARMLFKESFSFLPTGKIWIRTNEKPAAPNTGDSFNRRLHIIPFNNPIPESLRRSRDVVDTELNAEAEGIIAWAVRGFQWWNKDGLLKPVEVESANEEYKREQDITKLFFEECVAEEEGQHVGRTTLYQTFNTWARDNGYRSIPTAEAFARRVTKEFNQDKAVRRKVGSEFVWLNIRLTRSLEDMAESRQDNHRGF